jgi:glycine C-acetyltransferase
MQVLDDFSAPEEMAADAFSRKMNASWERIQTAQEDGLYYYFQPVDELDGPWVWVEGQRKLMFATYSYLDLLQHPRILGAAQAALQKYGAGSHGVRILGGTIDLHIQLEERIADFTRRAAAIVYSSGYVANLATISTLVGRDDWVLSDKWNHASIVDGCLLAQGQFRRFRHNDMADLERLLAQAPPQADKLIVADAVFSMDGDIFNLPVGCYRSQNGNAEQNNTRYWWLFGW